MFIIYKITNKTNGKIYIGQTNNWEKRFSHYKSASFNPNSSDYNRPIHRALRKYGIDNFNFEIIEEIDEKESIDFVDEREKFFIQEYKSLTTENGYNVSIGGQGNARPKPMTYQELINRSSIFSAEEIQDIQTSLQNDYEFSELEQKYPKLKHSFLLNINCGLAFKNPEFSYPLRKNSRSQFSQIQIKEMKDMIRDPAIPYEIIAQYFGLASTGYISMVNTGKYLFNENDIYPLRVTKYGKGMAIRVKELLKNTILSFEEIAKRCGYNQIKSIQKINNGYTYKDPSEIYPIRK